MLTKSAAAAVLLASTTNTAGSTTNSTGQAIGYGCSIIATITNGGTGPTAGCTATLQVSADGTTWYSTDDTRGPGTGASAVGTHVFNLGVGGVSVGDWTNARIQFAGNTGQSVTCLAVASATSAL
jgi:hypothetical protein